MVGVYLLTGAECGLCIAVGITLTASVTDIPRRLRAGCDVGERSGAGIRQRFVLLAHQADEHNEGLQPGGGYLQIKAAAIPG
ncbi:hypothetical protein SDC9_77405 [bioreactor metagenome]|uniref:Uncharacterized protein n=1 Tax=bioreactor metagenome TaxID=1076179 RepID=A0A644YXZ8_9ZZZZ